MPPKRGSSTPGTKRGGRGARVTPRGKISKSEGSEEVNKVDDSIEFGVKAVEMDGKPIETIGKVLVEERRVEMSLEEVEEEKLVEEETVVVQVQQPSFRAEDESTIQQEIKMEPQREIEFEPQPVAGKSFSKTVDKEVNESIHDDEKDERLDLEDNDQEYEPEEYCRIDYDEKESEQGEYHEQGDDDAGGIDEDNAGEEEIDDMGEEEIEEVAEEYAGEEEEDGRDGGQDKIEGADVEADYHQEALKERRKRKEFEVFVGGLDIDANEEDLKKVFGEVGEVTEVRLMVNPQTKKNKGFAFLRFATAEQAKRAVTELKNPTVRGKSCGVSPSQDSDTLFLGNICKTWTKKALKEKLKAYGIENTDDLTLVEDGDNKGLNRGFAFLEFTSRSEAKEAFKLLQKRDISFGIDKPAKVLFADSFIDPGDEIMAKVRTVFVDGLLPSWDEDQVRDLLQKYGKIEKIELARNMPSAKRKDFGFVTFDNHDIAVTCAKNINNTDLGNGDKKAKVRARLSRPLQKSRGRHSNHSDYGRRRPPIRSGRGPLSRPALHSPPGRGLRKGSSRDFPVPVRRTVGIRERRQDLAPPPRARPVYSPPRSYDRRLPVPNPIYPKSISTRDYRRVELPPRSKPAADYDHRVGLDRRQFYREEYSPRVSGYSDISRAPSHSPVRRSYADEGYARRFERSPGYREGRPRDYDSVSGTKRPYSALDEPSPQYADGSSRHSRPRLNYEISAPQYGDAYSESHSRNSIGYSSSRSLPSGHDSRGLYSSRQGSYGSSDVGGVYSSSRYAGDYPSRRPDVTSRSYSSLYSTRGAGGSSSYIDSRIQNSGSYY